MPLIISRRRHPLLLKRKNNKRLRLRHVKQIGNLRIAEKPCRWFVYVLLSDKKPSSYVGVTIDVERRVLQHNGEIRGGARFTRSGRPWTIGRLYGPYRNRSYAQMVEAKVKRLRGCKRLFWSSSEKRSEVY